MRTFMARAEIEARVKFKADKSTNRLSLLNNMRNALELERLFWLEKTPYRENDLPKAWQ